MKADIMVHRATVADAMSMHRSISHFIDKGKILPRALSEICEDIRDCFAVRKRRVVIACAALQVTWADWAEIGALAVAEQAQNQRVGSALIQACVEEARQLGIRRGSCPARTPAFFQKHSFQPADKKELPQEVRAECYRYPKFPACDEVALIRYL